MKTQGDKMKQAEVQDHEEDWHRPVRAGAETGGVSGLSRQQNPFV